MHYTLHLTQTIGACMSPETVLQARQLATPGSVLTFVVDGFPEVAKDGIRAAMEVPKNGLTYCIITNGVGLDGNFLAYVTDHHMTITLTWDGVRPLSLAEQLLQFQPYAAVALTVIPETLPQFADNVRMLYDLGFRYLYATMDPGRNWEEKHLPQLKRQYRALASFYRVKNHREEKLFLSPFDEKIADRIWQRQVQCALGQYEISVSPEGKLYPCDALCEDDYCIGDVVHGVNEAKRHQLYALNEKEAAECAGCAIHNRCVHHCACINKCATGSITSPSPFQCAHERILIPIADSLAERLYRERNALFMQKQYNNMYPLLSLAEEK